MMTIAIVEDNKPESEFVRECLNRFSDETGEIFTIKQYYDAATFLADFNSNFDIIFMDIEMPGIDGMEASKKFRAIDSEVILIFVTNMVQFAVNGYEVDALDFIVKPVSYHSFVIKLKRAVAKRRSLIKGKGELPLAGKTGIKRVAVSSIKYIEVVGHHLLFHTVNAVIDICGTLNETEERLKGFNFSRCNNCYLVNLQYVTEVGPDAVIVGGEKLQISRRRRKSFIDDLTVYMGDN